MDTAPFVRAVEVLTSPLEWSDQDAWLQECLRRVRLARGLSLEPSPATASDELEALLRLPGDERGWLRAALDVEAGTRGTWALRAAVFASDDLLPLASLRCALAAGLATLQRLHAWRTTLGAAFDDVDTGMAIFATAGLRQVSRNARWDELLDEEPRRDRLVELILRHAERAATTSATAREDDVEVELTGGSYRLVANRAAPGTLIPGAAVLVLMDRVSSALPTTQELRISFGLRGREPQVALLAAEGLSNADIARRLQLSAHTVRHYLERVMERLGLHSRKALALRLMGSGERPSPGRG